MINIDFKIFHRYIFTLRTLHDYGMLDDLLCRLCYKENETLSHMMHTRETLTTFHEYIILIIEVLASKNKVNYLDKLNYVQFLFGLPSKVTNFNVDFINNVLYSQILYSQKNINCSISVQVYI